MKLLFTTVPAYGHFHPLVPLARAAVARGDDVVVATGAPLASWVPACGLRYREAGRNLRSRDTQKELEQFGTMRPFHTFTTVLAPPMVRDLLRLAEDWRPDLIVHEEAEFGAPLAAELLGVPCVTHSYAAPARPIDECDVMRDLLTPIWGEFTADPVRLSGDRYLDACPAPFQTDAVDAIPNVQPVRPVSFDGPDSDAPSWLSALPRPAAYVTFGTVPMFSTVEVIQHTVDAITPTVEHVIVTTGPNSADTLRAAPTVIAEQYLPQSLVLDSVDVVVSHGGAGTTLGAIEHGLPHVVIPQMKMSQLRNAERIEALGIGLHVPQGSPTDVVRAATERALAEPAFAENAATIRASFDALPDPVDVLADLHLLAE